MDATLALRLAYAANIVVLVPVIAGLFLARNEPYVAALGGRIVDSEGLRLLVASLWGAILILSAAGLVWPAPLWPILLLQILYKSFWLAAYVLPALRADGPAAVPWGPTICFAAIVALWPLILLWARREGAI